MLCGCSVYSQTNCCLLILIFVLPDIMDLACMSCCFNVLICYVLYSVVHYVAFCCAIVFNGCASHYCYCVFIMLISCLFICCVETHYL